VLLNGHWNWLRKSKKNELKKFTDRLKMINYTDQSKYEEYLIGEGRRRFIKELAEARGKEYTSSTMPSRVIQNDFLLELNQHIEDRVKELKLIAAKDNLSASAWRIERIATDFISYRMLSMLTFKTILDNYAQNREPLAVKIANTIGGRIEDEVRFAYYDKEFNEKDSYVINKWVARPGANPKNRREAVLNISNKIADSNGITRFVEWSPKEKTSLGLFMLEMAAELNLIDLVNVRVSKKLVKKVVFKDKHIQDRFIQYADAFLEGAHLNHPLIEPPKNWELSEGYAKDNNSGGYHTDVMRDRKFMSRDYDSLSVFGQKTTDTLNTLQTTAWRIDSQMLEIANTLNDKFISVDSFRVPEFDKPTSGGCPAHILADKELHKKWRQDKAELHTRYQEMYRYSVRSRQTLKIAGDYEHTTFFLSWSADYRSRFYPMQSWLHPQATDFEKSLLKFRDGCKITAENIDYCKQAIGAAYKGSRISHDERIQWVDNNAELLRHIAENPESTVALWEVAKEPWQFLQLCLEWHSVVVTKQHSYWKVPIGADATASGLQLLSGMRLDKQGMKYANLLAPETPSSPPEDAYMKVLEYARELAADGYPHLEKYLHWRSLGKPALMVSLYNGSWRTIRESIVEALEDEGVKVIPKKEAYCQYDTTEFIHYSDTSHLTTIIRKASRMVFPMAFEALDYLSKVFKAAVKKAPSRIYWTVPTGDTIHVQIHEFNTEEIATKHYGRVKVVADGTRNGKGAIDSDRVVAAAIPGFVHSFDAALCKEAFSQWLHPLALTHDCFKCLPSDMERALDRVRDAFVTIVKDNPLKQLAEDLGVQDSVPELPLGDGKLNDIYNSKYMFN